MDEALEAMLFRGKHGLCGLKIYDRLQEVYKSDKLGDLFSLACRSTEEKQFNQYMKDIKVINEECYSWLMEAGYQNWALYCIPDSAKVTHVTNKMSHNLRKWMHNYNA